MAKNSVKVDPETGQVTLSLADLQTLLGSSDEATENTVKVTKAKPKAKPRFRPSVEFTKNSKKDREKYGDITITKHYSETYSKRFGMRLSDAVALADWTLEEFEDELS